MVWFCARHAVRRRKDADHETTPMGVSFHVQHEGVGVHVQHVCETFVQKVDEEETLLVMVSVTEVNKNLCMIGITYFLSGWARRPKPHPHRLPMPIDGHCAVIGVVANV